MEIKNFASQSPLFDNLIFFAVLSICWFYKEFGDIS